MPKPFVIGGIFLAILAVAMVAFYKVKERSGETDTPMEEGGGTVISEPKRESSPLEGVYSSADGALEAGGKRIGFFQVVARDGGGFGGVVRVETVGANPGEGSSDVDCQDVKVADQELFLRCANEAEGSISFESSGAKAEKGQPISGRLLWTKAGNAILDGTVRLTRAQ